MTLPAESYHETIVEIDGERYELFNLPFEYELTCTRVGGWQLWKSKELIGGEFGSGEAFKIYFGDTLVFEAVN